MDTRAPREVIARLTVETASAACLPRFVVAACRDFVARVWACWGEGRCPTPVLAVFTHRSTVRRDTPKDLAALVRSIPDLVFEEGPPTARSMPGMSPSVRPET